MGDTAAIRETRPIARRRARIRNNIVYQPMTGHGAMTSRMTSQLMFIYLFFARLTSQFFFFFVWYDVNRTSGSQVTAILLLYSVLERCIYRS